MRRLPLSFFTFATLCGLTGMGVGFWMGRSENFTMAPAHAHLNLLGWVTMSLMGAFYALAGELAPTRLGWLNFVLSALGVVVMIPSLALLLAGSKTIGPVLGFGEALTIAGMVVFLLSVLTLWRKTK